MLLQNTRYRAEETKNGEEFSKELGSLADIFVNDAFGTAHRAHCSTVGVVSYVKEAVAGYLIGKELKYLGDAVENPVRPFVTILGGAKVADKLSVIENLLNKADTLIIGGGMAGLTAAIYALRAGKSVLLTEKETFGGQITSAPRLENYPGMPGVSGNQLTEVVRHASGHAHADHAEQPGALEKRHYNET